MTVSGDAGNPTILGGGGLAKVMYDAHQLAAEQYGEDAGPPWALLDGTRQAHWITTANVTIDFLHDVRLVDKRYAQLRRGTGVVLPSQHQ